MESTKLIAQVLSELHVRPVVRSEEERYQAQMARHHYLGDLAKIGETIWYVAICGDQWVEPVEHIGGGAQMWRS